MHDAPITWKMSLPVTLGRARRPLTEAGVNRVIAVVTGQVRLPQPAVTFVHRALHGGSERSEC